MTQNVGTKTFLGLCCSVLIYFWQAINEVFIILLVLMILDYLTGVVAGMFIHGFSWQKAWTGVLKKVMYGPLLILGFSADYTLIYLTKAANFGISYSGVIGIAACIYLIGTEGFSVVQNLLKIGVPAPEFLLKVFGLIRDSAGNLVQVQEKKCPPPEGGDPNSNI